MQYIANHILKRSYRFLRCNSSLFIYVFLVSFYCYVLPFFSASIIIVFFQLPAFNYLFVNAIIHANHDRHFLLFLCGFLSKLLFGYLCFTDVRHLLAIKTKQFFKIFTVTGFLSNVSLFHNTFSS